MIPSPRIIKIAALLSTSGNKMINFVKYLNIGCRDLMTPSGGVASHTYFNSQHYNLHHNKGPTIRSISLPSINVRQIHCSCQMLNNGPDTSKGRDNSNNTDPELKAKLEEWKEKLSKNVYYEKYKEKFQQLEITSPRELLAKLEQLDASSTSGKPKSSQSPSKTHKLSPGAYSQTKTHTLQEVMEVDLLKDLGRDDIVYLWQEFHRKKEGLIAAVMSGSVFDRLADLASIHTMFIMPLPRDHGYEFFLLQYMDKTFHFTPLVVYQAHKENAPECLRLINYTDLQSSKDLVLMRGEFDKNMLTTKDAHIMAVQVNFYYGETSESRQKLLEVFTSSPDTFQHLALIDEFKILQETHPHLFELDDGQSA